MEVCGIPLAIFFLIIYLSIRHDNNKAKKAQAQIEASINAEDNLINNEVRQLIKSHIEALQTKRLQKRRMDEYGIINDQIWNKELEYFLRNVMYPKYAVSDIKTFDVINEEINRFSKLSPYSTKNISEMTPKQFEAFCTGVLIHNGWKATTTKASGDQGVDIVAKKNGIVAVFQVKKVSKPVGNKAVQEIIAGKEFYSANCGFVISNVDYTPSAKELANKSGIKLIHYSELHSLDKLI